MATFRPILVLRGVPARLGAVLLAGAAVAGWAIWPTIPHVSAPPMLALEGKRIDRLAFAVDESEIPVREARIFDTIAMFSQPQAQPRAWSEAPLAATVQDAGARTPMPRPGAIRSAAAKPADVPVRPLRTARMEPRPVPGAESSGAIRVFGWDVPGTHHLPSRRDAVRAIGTVGSGAAAVGSGSVGAITRTASTLGDGIATAGGVIADQLGLN